MKRTLLNLMAICAVIFAVSLTSCKKDDTTRNQIVGKWYVKSVISYQTFNGVPKKDTAVYTDNYNYYQFNSDGSIKIIDSDTIQEDIWSVNKTQITIGINTPMGNATKLDYNLSGNSLKLHRSVVRSDWTIDQTISLTKAQ